MPSATLAGMGAGLFVKLFSNGLRKMPLMREPWEHVLLMGAGAMAANAYVEYEVKIEQEVKDMMASHHGSKFNGVQR
eukprot:CAMPEP_0198197150 /NCGR_PEP_ID=MMETSP1445-20131203/734_1 /TAXON_ID=36898 /ORGANISM="Pyramimonas sp., Strain CCMP2087" /LENGTH=76 /DNA_ID=CAMNT_0043866327 /DNA_START=105 /DNA_END=335 /DNA_ORIENTATION=-